MSEGLAVVALLRSDFFGVVRFFARVFLESQEDSKFDCFVRGVLVFSYHSDEASGCVELEAVNSVSPSDPQSLVLKFLFNVLLR